MKRINKFSTMIKAPRKPFRTGAALCLIAFAAAPLAACETVLLGGAAGSIIAMNHAEKLNLVEMNYAVADYLAGQTLHTLNKRTPIGLGILSDSSEPQMTSAFGRLVTEQIGTRLSQLGYNVQIEYTDLFEGQKARTLQKPKALLTGTYSAGLKETDVNVRLVSLQSGQILGSFDYVVPTTAEMKTLTAAEPRIMRMEPSAQ